MVYDIIYKINYHNSNKDFSVLVRNFKEFLKSIKLFDTREEIQPGQQKEEKKNNLL